MRRTLAFCTLFTLAFTYLAGMLHGAILNPQVIERDVKLVCEREGRIGLP